MENTRHFTDLIPYVLRSVPYVHQSHTCKAYCALEQLYASKPHLSDEVWKYCVAIIREDEPKVQGVIAPELLEIDEFVDPTSGRTFGPDWILGRGLMPLSYWAMHRKVQDLGFTRVLQAYTHQALEHPRYLGHEISILAAHGQFYREVVAHLPREEDHILYLQRFTEYITATYASGEGDRIAVSEIEHVLTEDKLLVQALRNPGFFGHHILAFVWGTRLKPWLDEAQQHKLRYSQTVLSNGYGHETAPQLLTPINQAWSETEFDHHLTHFFLEGPKNIHQITLAEALLWCWTHHQEHRGLVAANLLCFTDRARP